MVALSTGDNLPSCADGIHILYKTAEHLKSYYSHWSDQQTSISTQRVHQDIIDKARDCISNVNIPFNMSASLLPQPPALDLAAPAAVIHPSLDPTHPNTTAAISLSLPLPPQQVYQQISRLQQPTQTANHNTACRPLQPFYTGSATPSSRSASFKENGSCHGKT